MSFELRDYLQHILEESEFLIRESTGLSAADFHTNPLVQRAFVRSLEVIGEAAKKLPPEFRAQHTSIDWRRIAGCEIA